MSNPISYDYSNFNKRFVYVDAYFVKNNKHSKWERIRIDQLDYIRKKSKNTDVFATIQQFTVDKHIEDEEQYAPLYFDFDYDSKNPEESFKFVQADVQKLIQYFATMLDLGKTEMRVWFSGKKGFHLLINPIVLGVVPHPGLTYIYRNIALYLKELLDLKTIDPVVYTIRRVLRLADSIHSGSKLHKIELDPAQITLPLSEIKKLAKDSHGQLYDDSEFVGLSPRQKAQIFFNNHLNIFKKQQEINKLKPQKIIKTSKTLPVCIKDLLENGLKIAGTRNNATMCLACYCKDQGYSIDQAIAFITKWTEKIQPDMTSTHGATLIANTKSCIKSIYDEKATGNKYHFICSFMRSLDVTCNHDMCHIAKEEDQKPEHVVEVTLAEASNGAYVGKKLLSKIMIVGKDTSPFIVPARVQFLCTPNFEKDNSPCGLCKVGGKNGRLEIDLDSVASYNLELINCTTIQQISILKKLFAYSKCSTVKINIQEHRNIEEVELNPAIDFKKEDIAGETDYVMRKGYYIGHKIESNNEYKIMNYIVPDPKTQHAIHIFNNAEPLETSLTAFKMDNELYKKLRVFQVNESVEQKIKDIYNDFERNILHIWERKAMILTMDLVYHSVLRFAFHGSILNRGWVEGLIVGDSGQAKSDCFSKLKSHYRLGIRISGEGSRRTGLAWTWQQTANRWFVRFGLIPNNDKRMVCIDEATGIDEEQLEKLTDMRSEGIADATGGPIPAKAYARTRILWMSNARNGKSLRTFMFPVEAIPGIFKKSEDVRRIDFAIGAVTGVVSDRIIHVNPESLPPVEHKYTSYLCNQLILWAWTRRPDDVIFDDDAMEEIRIGSLHLGKKYSAQIPLVESTVMRIKLARLAVALATRLFSTNDEEYKGSQPGEKVIVKKEHVEYIIRFLDTEYSNTKSLDYANYSVANRLDSDAIWDGALNEYIELSQVYELTRILMTTKYWTKNDLADMLGYEKDEIKQVMFILSHHKLVEKTSRSQYRMNTAGIDFVKRFHYEVDTGKLKIPNMLPKELEEIKKEEVGTSGMVELF